MKKIKIALLAILLASTSFAPVGIGTTSPNTTLDVRGSLAGTTVETKDMVFLKQIDMI